MGTQKNETHILACMQGQSLPYRMNTTITYRMKTTLTYKGTYTQTDTQTASHEE